MSDSGSWQPPGDQPPSQPPPPQPGWGAPPPPPPPGAAGYPPPPPGGYAAPPGYPPPGYAYGPPRPADAFGRPLADWWRRLVAWILDWLITAIPLGILSVIIIVGTRTTDALGRRRISGGGRGLAYLIGFGGTLLYYAVFEGSAQGQTPGKMAMRIQVRDARTGGPIGFGRALLRKFVFQLLMLLCFLPGLIDGLSPLWDPRRQAWHDHAANAVVIDLPA
ncbi:MAG: hypothetical protein JWO37_4023 [Acidimicrobiales bacterium]|nr:hypothetical protein [Acidimicrobiales bacterium]